MGVRTLAVPKFSLSLLSALTLTSFASAQTALHAEAIHVMGRLGYGATAAELDAIQTPADLNAWIQTQLTTTQATPAALTNAIAALNGTEPVAPNFNQGTWNHEELRYARILNAIWSPNQLRQRMANFWRVLFNTNVVRITPPFGENLAVGLEWKQYTEFRQHALGNFRDLLDVSIDNVSMRVYLDLAANNDLNNPNENYARELLELHTLGPELNGVANYTDEDIKLIGRDLVGLGVNFGTAMIQTTTQAFPPPAVTLFMQTPNVVNLPVPSSNDPDAKADLILDHLTRQRQTARYICTRLVQEFVTDEEADLARPEIQGLIANCMLQWGTNGNITAVLTALFGDPVFRTNLLYRRNKIERPLESVASQMRVLDTAIPSPANVTDRCLVIDNALVSMGQEIFHFPSPDGYPLSSFAQAGSSRARERWRMAFNLTQASGTSTVDSDPVAWVLARGVNINSSTSIVLTVLNYLYPGDYTINDSRRVLAYLELPSSPWSTTTVLEKRVRIRQMMAFVCGMTQAYVK